MILWLTDGSWVALRKSEGFSVIKYPQQNILWLMSTSQIKEALISNSTRRVLLRLSMAREWDWADSPPTGPYKSPLLLAWQYWSQQCLHHILLWQPRSVEINLKETFSFSSIPAQEHEQSLRK